jgi:cysteine-rich repeat protein/VCBS repeat-containing protein
VSIPAKLNFQSRLAQAGILLGDRNIGQFTIKVYDLNQQLLCGMDGSNLQVRKSVFNYEIKQTDLRCDLAKIVATRGDVIIKVCLDTSNCLRPIRLSTVPYAYRSQYTYWALQSKYAERSSISNFAQWITADRDLVHTLQRDFSDGNGGGFVSNITGRFDMRSSILQTISGEGSVSVPLNQRGQAGVIAWSPNLANAVSGQASSLHLVGKDLQRDTLKHLDRISMVTKKLNIGRDLIVDGDTPSATTAQPEPRPQGLTLARGDLLLKNPVDIEGRLEVRGDGLSTTHVNSGDPQDLNARQELGEESSDFGGFVGVSSSFTPNSEVFTVNQGDVSIVGKLSLGDDLHVTGGVVLNGNSLIRGRLHIAQNLNILSTGLRLTLSPTSPAETPLNLTSLIVREHPLLNASLSITQGDMHIKGVEGLTVDGLTDLRSDLLLTHFGSSTAPSFSTQRLSIKLIRPERIRSSSIFSANGNTLAVGQLGEKMVIHGVTRLEGRVRFAEGTRVRNTGGCRIEVPADQVGRDEDDIERYELICGSARVTVRPFRCGNGKPDQGEQCDDDNLQDGDGCSSHCLCEPQNLIDGVFFPPEADGDVLRACAGDLCGNSKLDAGEECDDGSPNLINEDDVCELCRHRRCGNAIVSKDENGVQETCDDGNNENNDGCDSTCQLEDEDGDNLPRAEDNCPEAFNPDQEDANDDGEGDACEDDHPVANNVAINLDEDASEQLNLLNHISDADDQVETLNISIIAQPANATLSLVPNTVATYLIDPNDDFDQSFTFTYQAQDVSGGRSQVATVTVTMTPQNDAPVAVADTYRTNEETQLNTRALQLDAPKSTLDNDSDVDHDQNLLIATLVTDPNNTAAFNFANDGNFTYTPQVNFAGNDTFTYKVVDPLNSESQVVTVTINVIGLNDRPEATFSVDQNTTEDDAQGLDGILTYADDDVGDVITFSLVGGAIDGFTLNVNNGVWSFDPSQASYQDLPQGGSREVVITYAVTDQAAASDQESFTITVSGSNDTPQATFDAQQNVNEGSGVLNGNLTGSDVDIGDENNLVFADTTGGRDGLTINADGSFTFNADHPAYNTLAAGGSQTINVTYSVSDPAGSSGDGAFTIVVSGQNDAPQATFNAQQNVAEGSGVLNGTLTGSDVDTGDQNNLTFLDTTGGVDGLTINADGSFTFDADHPTYNTLAAGGSQTINVTYSVSDPAGSSGDGAFTIVVSGQNDAPQATFNAQQNVDESSAINGTLTGSDVDTGDQNNLAFADTTGGRDGLTINADGSFTFDANHPAYNELAEDEERTINVTYSVSDPAGDSENGAFDIVVRGTNDPPVATFSDVVPLSEGTGVQAGQLSADDVDQANGVALTYAANNDPAVEGLTINADGSFSFDTDDAAYTGLNDGDVNNIQVNYTVTDSQNAIGQGSFTIQLNGVTN